MTRYASLNLTTVCSSGQCTGRGHRSSSSRQPCTSPGDARACQNHVHLAQCSQEDGEGAGNTRHPLKTLIPSLVPYRFTTLLLQLPREATLRESTGSQATSCSTPSHTTSSSSPLFPGSTVVTQWPGNSASLSSHSYTCSTFSSCGSDQQRYTDNVQLLDNTNMHFSSQQTIDKVPELQPRTQRRSA